MTQREHPMLFTGDMVRAILAGRKTQTRRVVKEPVEWVGCGDDRDDPANWGLADECGAWVMLDQAKPPYFGPDYTRAGEEYRLSPPWDVGDRLWVRETWKPDEDGDIACVTYRADNHWQHIEPTREAAELWLMARRKVEQWPYLKKATWRPSIHMPRWASRITLEVTGVRVERLQDISGQDAKAEGVQRRLCDCDPCMLSMADCPAVQTDLIWDFADLWRRFSTKPGRSWVDNPWVWVVSFKRAEQ